MRRFRAVQIVVAGVLVLGLASVALGMKEQPRPLQPPDYAVGKLPEAGPFVIVQQGGTTWVQPYPDTTYCPGDPLEGHGGEALGGPDGSETWCFEGGPGDTCGVVSPWDILCFDHVDVRTFPSQTGINFWHVDAYRADEVLHTGSYSLWCGSDSIWPGDGNPVECGTWAPGKYPGYGNQWNCIVQLDLTGYTTVSSCSLWFDPRYDLECKYDYFYVDFFDGSDWVTVATFNAASNNPGTECGSPTGGNPDYWGNTDSGQPNSASWQTRSIPSEPAFFANLAIWGDSTLLDSVDADPQIRWRMTSDGAWSDADGRGNTDGAAFIDNVWVGCDNGRYVEDFEGGPGSLGPEWIFPDPDAIADAWHIIHDPDPPYEGGDGDERTTCTLDSSFVWAGRPIAGYPGVAAWRNGWFYRLQSPSVPIENTGCIVQYDQFMCALDYTCDYTDTKVRFYNGTYNTWCPWINIDNFILYGGCFFWNFNSQENVTPFYGADNDSMQFAWDLMDVSSVGDFCRGKHKSTELQVDNVSVGFYDGNASLFSARSIDIFQDTFHDSLPSFNSFFDTYDSDTLNLYSGPPYVPNIPRTQRLYVTITDKNTIVENKLIGSVDEGATWVEVTMAQDIPSDPSNPALGGDYYANFTPEDFYGVGTRWPKGTEVWYYVRCEDALTNYEYFPARANPGHPDWDGGRGSYFTFSILPMYPVTHTGPRILLVDGYGRNNYDYSECMAANDNIMPLEDIYENTLRDAGYCYDKYDISGAGSNQHIHPTRFGTFYDAIVWFTGPYFSNYLFDKEAQVAIRDWLQIGGKVVLCGDRIAYNMAVVGEDSLGGEFLGGVMGSSYKAEMEGAFTKPYIYLQAAPSVTVFGVPTTINPTYMDSIALYRECPYLKDMSYVVTNSAPPAGYTAQPLLYVLNPDPAQAPAHGAVYVESQSVGQCVYLNYDMCAFVNHTRTECDGSAPSGMPTFTPGAYYGRVEFLRTVLERIMLLPSTGTGNGGTSGTEPKSVFRWALNQNTPNPCAGSTQIRFEVARTSDISIKVYNAMGQLVRTLENRRMDPGRYSVHWDGTNAVGQRVSSGVYFYKMQTKQFEATQKMLVLK
jgi:hypothetical protein